MKQYDVGVVGLLQTLGPDISTLGVHSCPQTGFPFIVLGIKSGNREKSREKEGNLRSFVEWCSHALLIQLKYNFHWS